jgi:undecaprenyl diphosphate synthase
MRRYVLSETARLVDGGARLSVIGRRERLPAGLVAAIATAEQATAQGKRLHLRIAVDYSGRDAILAAVAAWPSGATPTRESFARLVTGQDAAIDRDVDLLIRSGGEKRLSDFLLWECAYAEFFFTDRLWPDFADTDLAAAVAEFRRRERRFGAIGPNVPPASADTAGVASAA